jgi:GST-like protein
MNNFKPEFVKLSPFSKIPVITDHDNNESIFESGGNSYVLREKKVESFMINKID